MGSMLADDNSSANALVAFFTQHISPPKSMSHGNGGGAAFVLSLLCLNGDLVYKQSSNNLGKQVLNIFFLKICYHNLLQ
jgi:hypothetical protein